MTIEWWLFVAVIVVSVSIIIWASRRPTTSEDLEQRIAADSSVCGARFISSQAVDSHQYGGSPEFIELLNEIEELRKAADAQLEQVRQLGRLLDRDYPMRLTCLQQKRIEAALPPALLGKKVSAELEVRDVTDNASVFFWESRHRGGFWVELVGYDPFFMVACQTYNGDVVSLQRGHLAKASGYVAEVKIQWPSILLMVADATISRANDRPPATGTSEPLPTEQAENEYLSVLASEFNSLHKDSFRTSADLSYQTAPLVDYPEHLRERAEELFDAVQKRVRSRAKKHKGSYSVFTNSCSETVAKIVLYKRGLGREFGRWCGLADGIYILVRRNGSTGRALWKTDLLLSHAHTKRLDTNHTIGIAPKHNERFNYFRLEPEDDIGLVGELLVSCSSVRIGEK
jgi:hypothetical protein